MTSSPYLARNRANARKSTGPRTERGKAIVAGNARRHGVTGRPDPGRVAAWLALILDRPEVTPMDFAPDDEVGYRALALAEAEARRVAAEQALMDFEAGCAPPVLNHLIKIPDPALFTELDDEVSEMKIMLEMEDCTRTERRQAERLFDRLTRMKGPKARDMTFHGQHRLLWRYLSEARAQRRKAFAAWAEARAAAQPSKPDAPIDRPNSRNKANLQPKGA